MSDVTPPLEPETPPHTEAEAAAPLAPAPLPPPTPSFTARVWSIVRQLRLPDVFLLTLILIGIGFRFSWVNWSEGENLHPDEYGLTGTLTQLAMPKTIGDYFNTRIAPMSPYQKYDEQGQPLAPSGEYRVPDNRMRWGQWPLILIRFTAEVTGNTGYNELRLWGRWLSAFFDTLSLGMLFLIGWRLYGARVGLLAAALSALAVMQIQQSHFMTVDNFAAFFVTLTMYCAVRIAQRAPAPDTLRRFRVGTSWWYLAFGLAFGMALASRINLLPLAGMAFIAAVIAHAQDWQAGDRWQAAYEVSVRLALLGLVGALAFRVAQPMAFRAETGNTTILTLNPNPEWLESMGVAQAESSGQGGGPPGEQWADRPALIFPWVNMVLWGMGLPLGLAAWAGFAWALWRSTRASDEWKLHALPLVWAGGYFLFMGTRWVKSVRYFLPIYPFLALFAAWAIFELWRMAEDRRQKTEGRRLSLSFLLPTSVFLIVTLGTLAWAWGFTSIYRHPNTRIAASRWIYQNIPGPFNLHYTQADGTAFSDPVPPSQGPLIPGDYPYLLPFEARVTGTLTGFTLGHVRNQLGLLNPATVKIQITTDPNGETVLAEAVLNIDLQSADPRGPSASVALPPVAVQAGQRYYARLLTLAGGPLEAVGATIANESWDETLPTRIDGRDGFGGLYRGPLMEVRWQDTADKREMFFDRLAQADYVILPSQRAIWAASRLPNNYPMTMEYYRALFDGRLGFELVQQFHSPIVLGPLQISDVAGTWAWGAPPPIPPPADYPFNFNPLAAEEAFSVYDHAPVWIFKKRADFSMDNVRAILTAIDLQSVVVQGPREATAAPTLLMLPADRWAQQQAGGTWSAMFDRLALVNQNPLVGVVLWWLMLAALGWLALPLTHAALGGFADGGYGLTRTLALVIVTWLAWLLGSFQILPFTRATIALCVLALALVSGFFAYARRATLLAYVRAQWRHMLIVEGVLLALFVFDLLIRLGNPDLWHPSYGGERPMIFSFFNAVLKSTSFPPYNPWMAGAFLNYYYYGFVLLSVPVKLLGLMPSIAYNLLLPTLFSLAGAGAFSVAYNLVASKQLTANSERSTVNRQQLAVNSEPSTDLDNQPSTINNQQSPNHPISNSPILQFSNSPNPYLAGLAAALLMVVLGNLGQVHTFLTAFQRMGDPSGGATAAILSGLGKALSGQSLPMGTGEWYWNATRIVPNINGHGSEITEFPLFTFLYSDMHAHMINLPLTLLALAWAASYLLDDRRQRAPLESIALWAVGGLALGVTNPTNSWDFPTYLALGVLAMLTRHFLNDATLSRARLWSLGWRLALLVGLALALYQPFDAWFAPAYSDAKLNHESFVPLSAYLYIHGLFLFILTTFLLWETRRWLAETPATVLTTADQWFPWVGVALGLMIVTAVGLYLFEIKAALIAIPLMAWAGALLLRSPTQMPPAKQALLFLTGTALAITVFVELFSIGGDRMNTIFKFYMQVWTMFSVAAGVALAYVWAEARAWKVAWRASWQTALGLLVACAALYTITAISAKVRDRFPQILALPNSGCQPLPGVPMPASYVDDRSLALEQQPHTLDSMDFMTWSAYCDSTYFVPLAYDAEAIQWMQDNVVGSPTLVEANVTEYRWGNRFTIYTGLPGVVGWNYHTRQHRGIVSSEMVTRRVDEIGVFYSAVDAAYAVNFLKRYNVRYVIVGAYEHAVYPAEGLAKFDILQARGVLEAVYQNDGTVVYEVR